KRAILEEVKEAFRDGFWEPVVHRPLMQRGVVLWLTPEMLVQQGRSAGFGAFARQRLAHGRHYGHERGVHFSWSRNLLGVLGAPAVPLVMAGRILRHVQRTGRFRLRVLAALPLILALDGVWAYAEARGHLDMLLKRR
ncbi:MAG TPA: hypothetical protein VEU08_18280, partial [Vicinamibacterales bacterium]|nr:hypothetical protein [Vicinamibacterales bacterium]